MQTDKTPFVTIDVALMHAAFLVVVSHLSRTDLLSIEDLCADFDVLCAANTDTGYQWGMMALSESLRCIDETQKAGVG